MKQKFILAIALLVLSSLVLGLSVFANLHVAAAEVETTAVADEMMTPVFRFWNKRLSNHFYTISEPEKASLIRAENQPTWNYEIIAFSAKQYSGDCGAELSAVYRFYNVITKRHFYTISAAEKDYVIANLGAAGWQYEGIGYCASVNTAEGLSPLYRFWSSAYQAHFYTASEGEKNHIIANYPQHIWKYEGIAYYINTEGAGLIVTQVGPNCPVSTQKCVPCVLGDQYCRVEEGNTSGFKGWACQNNNPGNIRGGTQSQYDFRNGLIMSQGVEGACGQRGGYMVFRDYYIGREGLKAYLKAIDQGMHGSYVGCGNCSLRYFFSVYAPAGDQNDPHSYSNRVAEALGVNADTATLRWVVENNRLDDMVAAMQVVEGWFVQS